VLRARLQTLADRLAAEIGSFGHRVFTDSAPVLEVELAARSGLGWRGKHTLALSREAGSMFFLGELFVDLALPPTAAVEAHCGSCSACIDVCPTQAIVAPYRLDARRCIAYLTIEHAGPIPAELARRLAAGSDMWRRLVTDPVTGHLLDFGTRKYEPSAALREYIIARDRTCQFPGCARASYLCDLDHVTPFTGTDEGGATSADNLLALCRRHHRLKTHNHWTLRVRKPDDDLTADSPDREPREDSGETIIEWTSPRGAVYSRSRPQTLESHESNQQTDLGGGGRDARTDLEQSLAELVLVE